MKKYLLKKIFCIFTPFSASLVMLEQVTAWELAILHAEFICKYHVADML
jgi:hypothetical protein